MNLRGRTLEPLPRKSVKKEPCRRSGRNKTVGKVTLHKESLNKTLTQTKRRYSKKSENKTTHTNVFSKSSFPPVKETRIREVIQEFRFLSPEDSHMNDEALVIYECRACNSFFSALGGYLRHKQNTCTSLGTRMNPDYQNPLTTNETSPLYDEKDSEELMHDCIRRYCPRGSSILSESGLTVNEFIGQINLIPQLSRNFDSKLVPQVIRNNSSQNKSQVKTEMVQELILSRNHGNLPSIGESSAMAGSRMLGPVTARSLEASSEPNINCFETNSEMEENNTYSPTSSLHQSNLPEKAYEGSSHFELFKSSSEKHPVFTGDGNVIEIKTEEDSFTDDESQYTSSSTSEKIPRQSYAAKQHGFRGFRFSGDGNVIKKIEGDSFSDVDQCSNSSNNKWKTCTKIVLPETIIIPSEIEPVFTGDGSIIEIKTEENSSSDDESQYTNSLTSEKMAITPYQILSETHPVFTGVGSAIQMNTEENSFTDDKSRYTNSSTSEKMTKTPCQIIPTDPVFTGDGSVIEIKTEEDSFSDDESQNTNSLTSEKMTITPYQMLSETRPVFTGDGSAIQMNTEENSFSDDESQYTNSSTSEKMTMTPCQIMPTETEPVFTGDGSVIEIKTEEDSFSDDESQNNNSLTSEKMTITPYQCSSEKHPVFTGDENVIEIKTEEDSFTDDESQYTSSSTSEKIPRQSYAAKQHGFRGFRLSGDQNVIKKIEGASFSDVGQCSNSSNSKWKTSAKIVLPETIIVPETHPVFTGDGTVIRMNTEEDSFTDDESQYSNSSTSEKITMTPFQSYSGKEHGFRGFRFSDDGNAINKKIDSSNNKRRTSARIALCKSSMPSKKYTPVRGRVVNIKNEPESFDEGQQTNKTGYRKRTSARIALLKTTMPSKKYTPVRGRVVNINNKPDSNSFDKGQQTNKTGYKKRTSARITLSKTTMPSKKYTPVRGRVVNIKNEPESFDEGQQTNKTGYRKRTSARIALLKTTMPSKKYTPVRGRVVNIKNEPDPNSFDEGQQTNKAGYRKRTSARIALSKTTTSSSEKQPAFSIDGNIINMKIEGDSFPDDESQCSNKRTSARIALQNIQNSSKKYTSGRRSVVNIKKEPDSFSYDEGQQTNKRGYRKRTSSRTSLQEARAKRQCSMQKIKREFICEFCSLSFQRGSDYRYHKRDAHQNMVLGFKCPFCDAYLLQIVKLSFHVTNSHHEEKTIFGKYIINHALLDIKDPRICRI